MKRFFLSLFSLFFALFSLSGCKLSSKPSTFVDYVFGTVVTADIYGKEAQKGYDKCFEKLKALDNTFSLTITDSELSRLNNTAYKEPFKASDELFQVIKTALECCEFTDGALDISIGGLISLWGIGTENARVPSNSEIETFSGVNYKMITLDEENKTVSFMDKRVKIDLGAVAKGYAADCMVDILLDYDVSGACISIGGNVVTYGVKGDGIGFVTGISEANERGNVIATASGIGKFTAVTSGDYQRYFIDNGVKYHHILDSKTGHPVRSGLSAVTILTDSSFAADCLSTAVFVLGYEKGKSLVDRFEGVEAVFITQDGEILTSRFDSGFDFELLGEKN